MPSANSRRSRVVVRLASIAAIRLSAHLVAIFFVFHANAAGSASARARQRGCFRFLDRLHHVAGGLVGHAVQGRQRRQA
jgi:hypothetical protein